jgi:hypothetical protein
VDGCLYDSGAGYPAAKFGPMQMTQIEAGLFRPVGVTTRDGTRVQAFEWIGPTDGFTRIQRWEGD